MLTAPVTQSLLRPLEEKRARVQRAKDLNIRDPPGLRIALQLRPIEGMLGVRRKLSAGTQLECERHDNGTRALKTYRAEM